MSTVLLAALVVWNLVSDIVNVGRGLVPAVRLISQLIYAFAVVTLACFLYVFQKHS